MTDTTKLTQEILDIAAKYPLTNSGEYILVDNNATNFIAEVKAALDAGTAEEIEWAVEVSFPYDELQTYLVSATSRENAETIRESEDSYFSEARVVSRPKPKDWA